MKSTLGLKLFFVLAISALIVNACTPVPFTKRKQITGLYSTQEVLNMSYQSYRRTMALAVLSDNDRQVRMIKRVGRRIQEAAVQLLAEEAQSDAIAGFRWEYNLIENDAMVNAWCMPGGKVAFYTGILPICEDETGVAVVMGHEIAHAIAKHGQERINQAALQETMMSATSAAIGTNPTATQEMIYYGIGYGSQFGMLKYSRTHESESDEIGLYLMAAAGYDPREAPAFWERMAQISTGEPLEFLSTHPNHATRVKKLNELMPKALTYYEQPDY